nr:putative ribonuclease H-like domain-containing protein [Tanacetum cinerariifolium]
MAFISSAKHSSGNEEVNTTSVSTASTNVSTASANIRAASISQDNACAYIASQSNGSQIKFEDINQIDEDDIEEMDIKWNMALLSMRADRFWKKTGKKITIQGIDVTGFDKLKVECFNCYKMGHFARECRAPKSQDKGRRDNYRQGSKVKEQTLKDLMATDRVGWDYSYMVNDEENHALVIDEEAPTKFALMAKTSAESEVYDNSLCSKACKKNTDSLNSKITELTDKLIDSKNMIYHYKLGLSQVEARLVEHRNQEVKYCEKIRVLEFKAESRANCIESLTKELELIKIEKEGLDSKLAGFQTASKDLDSLLESQRLDKNKEGPSPAIESTSGDAQNKNPSVTETEASPSTISPKPFIKFVKSTDRSTETKTSKVKTAKPSVKYAAMYSKPSKSSNIRGNQRNWNNLKSQQLGKNFVMKNKACFNYGQFDHLSYNYGLGVKMGRSSLKNNYTHRSMPPKPAIHKPYRPPLRPIRPNMNAAYPNRTTFNKPAHSYAKRPFQRTSTVRPQFRGPRVPIVTKKFPTVNRKFPTGNIKFPTADQGNKGKAVKASACWIWKPTHNISNKGTHSTNFLATKDAASREVKKDVSSLRYISLPNWVYDALLESTTSNAQDTCKANTPERSGNPNPTASTTNPLADQMETLTVETPIPTVSSPVLTACFTDSQEPSSNTRLISKRVTNQEETPSLDNILTLTNWFEDILRVTTNSVDLDGMEADHVWSLAYCPKEVRPIRTKWVLKNKKDERGIVIKNKARLVAQGHTHEKGIEYDKVFAPVARIKAIRLFLAYAYFMGFTVYQMDVKSAFLYGTIDEEVYVMQPLGFQDPEFPARVYKVEKAMYGLHHAPRAWYGTLSKYLLTNGFQRGTIDQTSLSERKEEISYWYKSMWMISSLDHQIHSYAKEDGIFLSQDKYVGDILRKFRYSDVRSANTPIDKENPWGKDGTGKDVDLHLYRSMIGSLMYLTASRPDIMFAVCTCARHQVTPKECHLHAVNRIFRYLKGHPKLGLWYPKEYPFNLVAYSDGNARSRQLWPT